MERHLKRSNLVAVTLAGVLLAALSACNRQSMPGQPLNHAGPTPSDPANATAANSPTSETKIFAGTIGASNDLQMKLVRSGGDLSGSYSYLKIGKPITIKGTIDPNGNVGLSEFDSGGTQTGVFRGRWDASDQSAVKLEGSWSKPNTTKQIRFSLTEQPINFTGSLELVAKRVKESDNRLKSDIEAVYPQLSGADEARVARFNALVKNLVFRKIGEFKKNLAAIAAKEEEAPSDSDMRSDLNISHSIGLANDDLVSIGFNIGGYSRGEVHPSASTEAINYDLKNGQLLKLADLFQPSAAYLQVISAYCIEDLKKQAKAQGASAALTDNWMRTGAAAKPANYKSWTITKKGLVITFDPYQVGPYASGPQYVAIPYAALKDIVKLDGPLGQFVK